MISQIIQLPFLDDIVYSENSYSQNICSNLLVQKAITGTSPHSRNQAIHKQVRLTLRASSLTSQTQEAREVSQMNHVINEVNMAYARDRPESDPPGMVHNCLCVRNYSLCATLAQFNIKKSWKHDNESTIISSPGSVIASIFDQKSFLRGLCHRSSKVSLHCWWFLTGMK